MNKSKKRWAAPVVLLILGIILWLPGCSREQPTAAATKTTPAASIQVSASTSPGLSPEQIIANPQLIHDKIRSANPAYTSEGMFAQDPAMGFIADFSQAPLQNLSPLSGIRFGALDLKGRPVKDLTPLKGMPLVLLGLEDTAVTDLKPLAGMKLQKLYLSNTAVSDLSPLAGMPLVEMMLVGTNVRDLKPLEGAPLDTLWLNGTVVSDISPLSRSPLVSLTLEDTRVTDLAPLAGMTTLQRLHIGETDVSDITPLGGLHLKRLVFSPKKMTAGLEALRKMTSLEELGTSLQALMPPPEFWKNFDEGKIQ